MTASILQAKAGIESVKTGMPNADREAVARALAQSLADSYVLYVKTQGFHWNVVGPLFYGLHKLTETQYEEMAAAIDEIAERIRALGHPAPAGLGTFVNLSRLEDAESGLSGEKMIRALIADHETVSRGLRELVGLAESIEDAATADLATRRIDAHEKAVWMLRALLAD